MRICPVFILLILWPWRVGAQETPVVEIDKIVIVESVEGDETAQKPATVIPIKDTSAKSASVADVVNQASGVHIRRFGGLEEATSISIRGSSHEQVQVIYDGVPLETASGEGLGLAQIPVSSLSKIEIYKSFTPSELGGGAVGGVVHLKSRAVEKGVRQRYGFGLGSFFTFDALAEFSRGGRDHDVILGIDSRRTRGNFTFLDDNGTPLNPADDQRVARQNNHHQRFHPYLKWHHRFDTKTDLSWTHHVFRSDGGVPGLGTFQSQNASLSQTEWLSSLKINRKGYFDGKARWQNNLYWRVIKSQFSDPLGEIGLGAAQDNDNRTFVLGDRFVWSTDFTPRFLLNKGVEYVFERFVPKDYASADPLGSESTRQQVNLFVEPEILFFENRLSLTLQGQSLNAFYNINNDDPSLAAPGTFFSGRSENDFSVFWGLRYHPGQNFTLKASAGRAVRLPRFFELFGDQGNVLGNAQLASEKSLKFDGGILWSQDFKERFFDRLQFEAGYFESHVDDLIQFEVASGFARASNIGKARIRGVEFVALTDFARHFSVSANYTLQWAEDRAVQPGNFLVGRPLHGANMRASFERKNLNAGLSFNFIDDQYLDALNTQRVDNRLIMNFDAGYLFKKRYRFSLEARNITDSQVVDAVGFPLPGRSFLGRVDVKL